MVQTAKQGLILTLILTLALFVFPAFSQAKAEKCTTIKDQELETSEGDNIPLGFISEGPREGYNYQAQMYKGDYGYEGWNLLMKWNDAWLDNKDCDDDGLLDRHYGHDSYVGSGAWLTNHWSTQYENDGKICNYESFTKFVAVPEDAELDDGYWYTADGNEIGSSIWNQFAVVQDKVTDSCYPDGNSQYKGSRPGLGNW